MPYSWYTKKVSLDKSDKLKALQVIRRKYYKECFCLCASENYILFVHKWFSRDVWEAGQEPAGAQKTHRRAKVVSDLMSEGDVRDFRGNVWSVVLHCDDAGVQRLFLHVRVLLILLTYPTRASWNHTQEQKTLQTSLLRQNYFRQVNDQYMLWALYSLQ